MSDRVVGASSCRSPRDEGSSVILTWSTDADRILCVDPYPVNFYTFGYACRTFQPLECPTESSVPPPPADLPADSNKKDSFTPTSSSSPEGAAMDLTHDVPEEETWDDLPEEILTLSTDEILTRSQLIDNDIKVVFE